MVGVGTQSAAAAEAGDIECGERRRTDEFMEDDEDDSQYFTDAEDRSWPSHSRHESAVYEDCISRCASARASSCGSRGCDSDADIEAGGGEHCRKSSCVSECSLDDVDLEAGLAEIIKGSPKKAEMNCHICHLGLESAAADSGAGITLDCSCKGDLSYSHKQCAETWFKIRGNKCQNLVSCDAQRGHCSRAPGGVFGLGAAGCISCCCWWWCCWRHAMSVAAIVAVASCLQLGGWVSMACCMGCSWCRGASMAICPGTRARLACK